MDGRNTKNTPHIDPRTHHLVYQATLLVVPHGPIRHAIYVETVASCPQNGALFYVNGIPSVRPMELRCRTALNPLLSASGVSIRRIGWVSDENHFDRVRDLCETLPRPGQEGPESPGNCEEWTRIAISQLFKAGILLPLRPEDPTDTIHRQQGRD